MWGNIKTVFSWKICGSQMLITGSARNLHTVPKIWLHMRDKTDIRALHEENPYMVFFIRFHKIIALCLVILFFKIITTDFQCSWMNSSHILLFQLDKMFWFGNWSWYCLFNAIITRNLCCFCWHPVMIWNFLVQYLQLDNYVWLFRALFLMSFFVSTHRLTKLLFMMLL